jgi:ribosomal protein L3
MGKDTVTLHKRPVVALDAEKGILAIKGPIPGPNGSTVYLTLESSSAA